MNASKLERLVALLLNEFDDSAIVRQLWAVARSRLADAGAHRVESDREERISAALFDCANVLAEIERDCQ